MTNGRNKRNRKHCHVIPSNLGRKSPVQGNLSRPPLFPGKKKQWEARNKKLLGLDLRVTHGDVLV